MTTEIVLAPAGPPVPPKSLPALIERAGGAARFAWEEFFFAEHHNPHTQRAYQSAVRRFLAWAEGEGLELANIPAARPAIWATASRNDPWTLCPDGLE
jgi:hypothetical protein